MPKTLTDLLNDAEFVSYAKSGEYTADSLHEWLISDGSTVSIRKVAEAMAKVTTDVMDERSGLEVATTHQRRKSAKIVERWVVISDNHIPFQNRDLEKRVLQFIRDYKPYGIVIAGDLLDCFSLSRHHSDSLRTLRSITLTDEYREGRAFIDRLESVLPKKCIRHYIYGNHEDFYWRELNKGDRGKLGLEVVSPTDGLRMRERGWQVQEDWKEAVVRIGDHLDVTHGTWTGVTPCRAALLAWRGSCMFGHSHRQSSHFIGDWGAFNIGGLYDGRNAAFQYMASYQRAGWTNGFASVEVCSDGYFYTNLIQANPANGRFFALGRLY